ncbi:nuclear transport factor 2-like isoform X2 [Nymphaea colorata]|uniref:nuclear transport factor 2-like isoform X2 n=1 Tax=Nymphaea colorata TaxID=210225 RepID=UPI00129DB95E|nr:nuclear transport factor 2-like isoform X2 [Nymphaea colorata]
MAPEEIGNAFVEQYYHILHQSPELVCRFYHDSSVMGRPHSDGKMESVTTTQDINEKIMSLDYHNFKSEIKTVDSQNSFNGGVVVLVTGSLLGEGNSSRKFTQSFFLAPQEKGYYVLNDVFRLLDETDGPAQPNGVSEASSEAPLTPEKVITEIQDQHALDSSNAPGEELNDGDQAIAASYPEENSVVGEVESVEETVDVAPKEPQPVVEPSNFVQEEPVKKTYASILKAMKDSAGDSPAGSSAPVWVARPNTERPSLAVPVPISASETSAPPNNGSSDKEGEADGRSIYIRNLPMNATVVHLEDEFKKFGVIKPGGIQVRSNKQQGFCYGFVEFENSSAVQDALEASPVMIGGRQCFVEEKRTTSTARSSGRGGRFAPGRGGFRNDGQRGRGNFGGRGYGRGEVGNARGWGTSGRGGDSSQHTDQNGNGRASRYAGAGSTA